jgi:hypothetical protein
MNTINGSNSEHNTMTRFRSFITYNTFYNKGLIINTFLPRVRVNYKYFYLPRVRVNYKYFFT